MKIAVFFNLPGGGAKRVLYEQIRHLSKRHSIDIYTLAIANHTFCDLRGLVKNYFIEDIRGESFLDYIYNVYIKLPKLEESIAKRIDEAKYDVVLVHPDFFTQAPYILRYLKTPSLYYCHEVRREFYEHIPRISKFFTYYATLPWRYHIKFIDRQNIKKASKVLVNSEFTKRLVKKYYGIEAKVNYPGVDVSKFRKLQNIHKENMVLSVGGFNLLKGHDFTIRSLALIPQNTRPRLVIVGNGGEDEKFLLALAKKNGVDLRLYKDVSDDDLVTWYNKAKIFVYASRNEPFGLSPLESSSCKTPVVAVAEGGVQEILKNSKIAHLIDRNERDMSTKIMQITKKNYSQKDFDDTEKLLKQKLNWEKSISELENHIKIQLDAKK